MGGDIIPFKLLGLEMSGVYSKLCSFLLGTDPCNSAVLHMGAKNFTLLECILVKYQEWMENPTRSKVFEASQCPFLGARRDSKVSIR